MTPACQLLDVKAVAERLSCSPRHVHRLADAGLMPSGVKVGRLLRWDAGVVADWVAAGCPAIRTPKGRAA